MSFELRESKNLPADLVQALEAIPESHRRDWEVQLPKMVEVWTALPPGVPRSLMGTSIRGRMAVATTCFERYCKNMQLASPALDKLIDKLWRFVEAEDLGIWESDVLDVYEGAMDPTVKSRESLDLQFGLLPPEGRRMLRTLINGVGRGNLYAGILGWSLDTLWPTLLVLKHAMDAGVPLPDLSPFRRSGFDEFHGWGYPVPRGFLLVRCTRDNPL